MEELTTEMATKESATETVESARPESEKKETTEIPEEEEQAKEKAIRKAIGTFNEVYKNLHKTKSARMKEINMGQP